MARARVEVVERHDFSDGTTVQLRADGTFRAFNDGSTFNVYDLRNDSRYGQLYWQVNPRSPE